MSRPARRQNRPTTRRDRARFESLDPRVLLCFTPAAHDVPPSNLPARPAAPVARAVTSNVTAAAVAGLPALSSLPASTNYLHLDFDGAEEGFLVRATPAFTQDADLTTFSAPEQTFIRELWARVAEMYSPFNLNVTTVAPPAEHFTTSTRVIIGGDGSWFSPTPPPGLANQIHGFGNGSVAYVFSALGSANAFPDTTANLVAHEAGHNLGLEHQTVWDDLGNKVNEYRHGVIMGTGNRWSDGPSRGPGGIGLQDDIRGIAEGDAVNFTEYQYPGVGYRPGDAPETPAAAARLSVASGRFSAAGVAQYHTDQDWYSVSLPAGVHHVAVAPAQYSVFDARVEVRDAAGRIVGASDPSTSKQAAFAFTAPSAGTYRVGVAGARDAAGATTYGKVGSYTLVGGPGALDRFEPNGASLDATPVGAAGRIVEADLSIHSAADEDWFLVASVTPGTMTVETTTDPAGAADVNVTVTDGARVVATAAPTATPGVRRATVRVDLSGVEHRLFHVKVTGAAGATVPRYSISFSNPAQRPSWGVTNAVGPGAAPLQAGRFDAGGEGVAYHDFSRTNQGDFGPRMWEGPRVLTNNPERSRRVLVDTRAGEWVEHTIDVLAAGAYDLTVNAGAPAAGGRFHLELDGAALTGPLDVPVTADQMTTGAVTKRGITLPAGKHVLRLVIDREAGATGSAGGFEFFRFTPAAATPLPAYQQANTADGLVSIEAENYDGNTARGGIAWAPLSSPAYAGGVAMQAGPTAGFQVSSSDAAASAPRLDFRVNFLKAGTHYLWVRGASAYRSDDSFHAGLDGVVQGSAANLLVTHAPGWKSTSMSGAIARITVPAPGVHTVNLWMREDGVIVDKLLLTTNAAYVPTGTGPAASPRTAPPPTGPITLEAETAPTRYRVGVGRSNAGYTGAGYADFANATGDYVEWTFDAASAGRRTLTFRYANGGSADRPLELRVNGAAAAPRLSFVSTGSWSTWRTVVAEVNVVAGTNRIRLTSIGSNGANIDSLIVG